MPKQELNLFSFKSLLLCFGIALTALYFAFPGTSLFDKLDEKPTDIASLAYNRAAFNHNPSDPTLRIRLVKKLLEINQIGEASKLLEPLNQGTNPNIEVSRLAIQLKFRLFFEAQDVNTKKQLKFEFIAGIQKLYPQMSSVTDLDILAEYSMQIGEPAIAAQIYRKIIELSETSPKSLAADTFWRLFGFTNAEAATAVKNTDYYINQQLSALLAAQQGTEALKWAEHYIKKDPNNASLIETAIQIAQNQNSPIFARDWGRQLFALQQAKVQKQQIPKCQNNPLNNPDNWACHIEKPRDHSVLELSAPAYLNFLKSLTNNQPLQEQIQKELAANQLENSIVWIQAQLLQHPDSSDLIKAGLLIAKRQGNKTLSRNWGEKLTALSPKNVELLIQQIELEMTIPDLAKALSYAKDWLVLEPDSIDAHDKAADIALWAGDTDTALEQLYWLFLHTQNDSYLVKTSHLASATFKYNLLSELYSRIGNTRQLTEAEVTQWFKAQQNSGREDAGISLLQQYLAQWPKHESVWSSLAKAYELQGKPEEARTTLQHVSQHFGSDLDLSLTQAGLFIKLGKVEEAWQTLLAASSTAPPDHQVFWDKFAEIAFMVGAEPELLKAYQRNPKIGQHNPTLNYYFLTMLRQGKKPELYREFALKQYHQIKNPNTLLDLVSYNIQQQRWEEAQSLLAVFDSNDTIRNQSSQYCLAQAEIQGHSGNKAAAQQALLKALQLEPGSASTRSLLIWHLVAEKNILALTQLLQESNQHAANQPELWEAMAVGYRTIKQPKAAIHWYGKALSQWPSRQLLVMGYADVLQEANEINKAKQLWRYILSRFKPSTIPDKNSLIRPTRDFDRRYAELVRLYLGPVAGEQWLNWLQQHPNQDKTFSAFRINWFLSQQRQAQAQFQLEKATESGEVIPPWQHLALALNKQDVTTTRQILAAEKQQLSKQEEISALRLVGEDKAALDKINQRLDAPLKPQELQWLKQQALDLNRQMPSGGAFSAKNFNISELDIFNDKAELVFSHNKHRFFASYQDYFYSSANYHFHLNSDQRHEQTISGKWDYQGLNFQSQFSLGGGFRSDRDYFSLDGQFNYRLPYGLNAQLDAGFNQISNEGAVFRLAGLVDKIEARLSGELSKRELYTLNMFGQNLKTRSGLSVGSGYGGNFEVGYRVFFEHPETTLSMHGVWKQADLDINIPTEWQHLINPNSTMENIINRSYQELGVDLRLREGEFNVFGFTDRNFRYFLNTGGFFTNPQGSFGAKIEAGIGTRLFKNDELSLSGYYASVQGSVQSIPSIALELRYSRRFD